MMKKAALKLVMPVLLLGCATVDEPKDTGGGDRHDFSTDFPAADDGVMPDADADGVVPGEDGGEAADAEGAESLDGPADVRDGSDARADDVRAEEARDASEWDGSPGTCTSADFPAQAMCSGTFKCTLGTITGCSVTGVCDTPGPQGANQTCSASGSSDNCQKGFVCLGDGGSSSRCRKFCDADGDCGGGRAGCVIGISSMSCPDGLTGVKTCSFGCDYFTQTGCQAGQGCHFVVPESATRAYSDCTTSGAGTQNANCAARGNADCAPGYSCFTVDGTAQKCLKICNYYGGSPSCTGGTSCAQAAGGWPDGVGACL